VAYDVVILVWSCLKCLLQETTSFIVWCFRKIS